MIPPCPPEVCYGCSACVDACPAKALSFCEGSDTYLHVEVDASKCIGCGKCADVCPRVRQLEGRVPQYAFAAVNRKDSVRRDSSSGGAFSAVVEAIAEKDGFRHTIYVCGAEMTDSLTVRHLCVKFTNSGDIARFHKSKYICSDCSGVLGEIRDLVSDKRNIVVFSGTPCQVAALRLIVGDSYNGILICVDFACHGALSQRLFNEYRNEREAAKGAAMSRFEFKNKERLPNGTIYSRSAKIVFADGTYEYATRYNDAFLALYYNAKAPLRESCWSCNFSDEVRYSDITLCDAWGINEKYQELNPFEGVSGICFNTEIGMEYAELIAKRMFLYPCDFNFLKKHNGPLGGKAFHDAIPKSARDWLFSTVLAGASFSDSVKRYYSELGLK